MPNEHTPDVRTVGRYQILEELGRGAMAVVYKGHDPVIGRTVALKTIEFRQDDEVVHLRERLYREACAAGTLAHPNIVTIYDVIEEGGMTAVAMEFIEGQTLKDLIAARAPMQLDAALGIFEQIAAALDYASQKNIVHRDIKPANIMITPDGRVTVADFGIARTPMSSLTKASTILGTPGYMSPEQARGRAVDGRSDLFSATVVLYEMVTRAKPFSGRNLVETLERIVTAPPTPPNQFNPAIGPAVTTVFERAFAKDPDQRYKSGAELVSAMRKAAGRQRAVAPDDTPTIRLTPITYDPVLQTEFVGPPVKSRRTKVLVIAGAAAVAVVLVVVGFVVIGPLGNRNPSRAAIQADAAGEPGAGRANEPAVQPAAAPLVAVTTLPPATDAPRTTPSGQASASKRSNARVPAPTSESPSPLSAPHDGARAAAPTASVRVSYDGPAFPLTILADGHQIGHVSDGQTAITIDAGRSRLRAVNEQLFLDHDFGTLTLSPGERRTLSVPGTAGIFVGVRGENYTGLRILLDGRLVAGPYPAQLPRVAAASHKIQFRWSDGLLQGVDIADTIDLSNGRQFTIRAVPEGGQVIVQKLR